MDDKILRVASEVYSAPKVYALLLGSGISHAARIPTGQQLMDKLIRRIARPKGENIEGHPSEWYEKHFSEKPTYGSVIERLGRERADRSNLIRPYFERQPEDQDDDKLPTRAHRAIARLIKAGYIQVVLTTNFDRLLEQALEAQGISPHVIRTPQDAANSVPLQNIPVTIIKLHGDYQDIGILNTAEELNGYDPAINKLLDKVLSEWGLIICGWSAESDTALQAAFSRVPKSPYSTHWITYQGDMKPEAIAIKDVRGAEQIDTMGADSFFDELEQNVMALKSLDAIHELSPKVAAERVRRLLETNDLIKLETWLNNELEQAYQRFISQDFNWTLHDICPDRSNHQKCIPIITQKYFEVLETPLYMLATLCWHGKGELHSVISETLSRWMEIPLPQQPLPYIRLPLFILMYTVGIAAAGRESWQYLQAALFDPYVPSKNSEDSGNFLSRLYEETFGDVKVSGYILHLGMTLNTLLHPLFQTPLITSDARYHRAFDLFEMLNGIVYLTRSRGKVFSDWWIPPHVSIENDRSWDYIKSFWLKGGNQKSSWELIQTEPFVSSSTSINDALRQYVNAAQRFQEKNNRAKMPDYAEIYLDGTDVANMMRQAPVKGRESLDDRDYPKS